MLEFGILYHKAYQENGGCFVVGYFVVADISLNEIIESSLSFSHSF